MTCNDYVYISCITFGIRHRWNIFSRDDFDIAT